jgi:CHAT domain-containing protein/tetratricopeptide (TPR) repeat protein
VARSEKADRAVTAGVVFRRLASCAAVVALCVGSASAEDAPPARPFADVAGDAASAFEKGAEKPFATLVAAIDGDFERDPWIVADEFAARGKLAAARAFASAGAGPRWDGLAAYLARDDAAAARAAEADAHDAVVRAAKDAARVLELTEASAKTATPTTVLALDALVRRGDALVGAKRGADAIVVARAVEGAAERIGWTAGVMAASLVEGVAAQSPPQLDVLRATYVRVAGLARRLGHAVVEGQASANAAVVAGMSGDYAASLVALEQATDAYGRAPRSAVPVRNRAILLINLGGIRQRMGEAAGARAALDEALAMVRTMRSGSDEASMDELLRGVLGSLAAARKLTGDFDGALATVSELRASAQAAKDTDWLARAEAIDGDVRRESGDWSIALEAYKSARDRFAERSDEKLRLLAIASMGKCLQELGRSRDAVDLLRPTIEAQARLSDRRVLPAERRWLGEALVATSGFDEGLSNLRVSLAGALELGQREDVTRARAALAETLLATGDASAAMEQATEAVAEIPALVRDTAQVDAATTRRRWTSCFDVGLRAALALGDANASVRFLEAGRAGALLEGLRGRGAFAAAAVDPSLLSESATRRRARSAAELSLADAVAADAALTEIKARRAALTAAQSAEREIVGRIQRESRAAARIAYPLPIDATAARTDLAADEALVIYRALADKTVAAVLTRVGTRCVALAAASTWSADCAATSSPETAVEARAAAAARLADALVKPLGLGAETKRVLVSPDGALATVPLRLLFVERAAAFVPSATALHELRATPRAGGDSVLAVGDPDYAREPTLAPLPGTRAEVVSLAEPKTALLGADATPARFLAALAKGAPWRAVHLACHGAPRADDPWASAVALSATADESGRLTALQLAAAPMRADLVVLSACKLGGGRAVDAEGAVGVPQALLVAGARCVLANLWRVDDVAAQILMKSFYESWRDGRCGAAEALRIAQEKVRSDPRWTDPRHWAGWVLWGSPD